MTPKKLLHRIGSKVAYRKWNIGDQATTRMKKNTLKTNLESFDEDKMTKTTYVKYMTISMGLTTRFGSNVSNAPFNTTLNV